jgi:hypothetical protein
MRSIVLALALLSLPLAAPFGVATTGPDFTVTDVRVTVEPLSGDPAIQGSVLLIEVDVSNVGDAQGAGFVTVWAEATLHGVPTKSTIDRELLDLDAGESTTIVLRWTPIAAGDLTIVAEAWTPTDADTSNDRDTEAAEAYADGNGQGVTLR